MDVSNATISLGTPATPIEARAGDVVVVTGALRLADGSIVDAATTTDAPPGVDTGGLFDFAEGGLRVVSHDATTHEVRALVDTQAASSCARYGVASPCLPLRLVPLARSRLLTVMQLRASILGDEGTLPSWRVEALSPRARASQTVARGVATAGIVLAVVAAVVVVVTALRRRARSPLARRLALADRVETKARRIDPILVAPLVPALLAAKRTLRSRRLDVHGAAVRAVETVLLDLERRLDAMASDAALRRENDLARTVVEDIVVAVRAADEAARIAEAAPNERRPLVEVAPPR